MIDTIVLFIADVVLTGFARTGVPFAIQHWNVEPDLITCGKALGSGYAPLDAVIAGQKVVDAYCSGTGEFTPDLLTMVIRSPALSA